MPRTKKVEIFFTFFLMANLLPMLPSFQLGIVQGGTSTFAACYAALVLPGLYNRRLCQLLNLTGLSVTMVSPDAMFPRCLLYNSFAVRVEKDSPHRLRKSVGKSGLCDAPNTLYISIIRLFI